MGVETAISWADGTLNLWTGCTKVSPACDGCYAEVMAAYRGWAKWGPHEKRHYFKGWRDRLRQMEKRGAERMAQGGQPWFVFCMSLGDVFDNEAPIEWLREILEAASDAPHCVILFLTKRPQIAKRRVNEAGFERLPPNIAVGCSVEDKQRAMHNLPYLCNAGGVWDLRPAFLFVSCEPLLEDIAPILEIYLSRRTDHGTGLGWISWVLVGGETDQGKHKARISHPEWFKNILGACQRWGAVFHMKQWGEWRRWEPGDGDAPLRHVSARDGATGDQPGHVDGERNLRGDTVPMSKVGHKAAGRLLNGKLYDGRPEFPLAA